MKKILLLTFLLQVLGLQASVKHDTIPTPTFILKLKELVTQSKKNLSSYETIALQTTPKDSTVTTKPKINYWVKKHKAGFILTQTSFVNWTRGGNNTIAGIANFNVDYNFKKEALFWNNGTNLRYGLSQEEGKDNIQKTDDIIELKSTFGYQTHPKSDWYYAGEFNLTTQFSNGYKTSDVNRTTPISKFLSPGRIRLGIGSNYTSAKNTLKLHLSPITNQTTLVLDQKLANSGAFGVQGAIKDNLGNIITKGENSKVEFGALIKVDFQKTIMENTMLKVKSSFYSDYVKKFGNVDSDINIDLEMKVNQYIKANINSHILYDDDAKIVQQDGSKIGPRVQLKNIIGVGLTYTF